MEQGYKKLIVWQKSILLVTKIYNLTSNFPKSEEFGLSSQMRRAAVSISSNIAEGSRRKTSKDKNHFYITSFSSAAELETQLEIVKCLGLAKDNNLDEITALLDEVLKMLNKLTSY